MTTCIKCERGRLNPFIDRSEAIIIHMSFWPTIIRAIEASINKTPVVDICRCDNCNTYGFECPKCGKVESSDSNIKHNDKKVCSKCRQTLLFRNPSNFLSSK